MIPHKNKIRKHKRTRIYRGERQNSGEWYEFECSHVSLAQMHKSAFELANIECHCRRRAHMIRCNADTTREVGNEILKLSTLTMTTNDKTMRDKLIDAIASFGPFGEYLGKQKDSTELE